jgi:hypothetical protein
MKLIIEDKILAENNLSLSEYLCLLFNAINGDTQKCVSSLIKKGWGGAAFNDKTKLIISDEDKKKVLDVILDSDVQVADNREELEALAVKLKELFPKGNKPGTCYSWRGNTAEIVRKLKNLIVKYHCKFTEEEAIEATSKYVASFNGDYRYMRLLKYFLLKTSRDNEGGTEIDSDFMTYLENKDAGTLENSNWTIDLA